MGDHLKSYLKSLTNLYVDPDDLENSREEIECSFPLEDTKELLVSFPLSNEEQAHSSLQPGTG